MSVTTQTRNIFSWIELIVMCQVPIRCCDNLTFKRMCVLDAIDVDTLTNYLHLLGSAVERSIKKKLSSAKVISMTIDYWKLSDANYVGVYVSVPDTNFEKCDTNLLCVIPSFEGDLEYTEADLIDMITSYLGRVGKSFDDICFINGSNIEATSHLARYVVLFVINFTLIN
jgi:hypothetical protein